MDVVRDFAQNAKSPEHLLGKGLNIPNNITNSGPRKIMNGIHQSHTLVLTHSEVPYVATGSENDFGNKSSSILTTDTGYNVIGKIERFSQAREHNYYLILEDPEKKKLHVVERISYKHKTEVYGYLYNNNIIDSYEVGSYIPKGTTLRRSIGFDKFGNKTNGTNLNVAYMSLDDNMEDSVLVSDIACEKMEAPLIKKVSVILNDNDIPLNIYGDENRYKVFPDIGEKIENGILLSYRRENKEESIYSQAISRLRQIEMSDTKITITGTVLDIRLYCNNREELQTGQYNQQLLYYYNDRMRMCNSILSLVGPYIANGYTMTYDLNKLFTTCQQEVNGVQFLDKNKFSKVELEFTIMEERKLEVGDKVADRYGGKGVVSKIIPHELMPKLPNGMHVDMIKNSSTMYGRENPGQMFELELNNISMCILDHIRNNNVGIDEAFNMILDYIRIVSELLYEKMRLYVDSLDENERVIFLQSIISKTCIPTSNLPITEVMTIDKLDTLYKMFPFAKLQRPFVPIVNSNGDIRFVPARRTMIIAPQYCIRLKQFAEEKFSAVSLSSTNIKNENAKSKASKTYNEPFSSTSIKFGQMETGEFLHMGPEIVVLNLMLHSLSPHGRRLVEKLATGDPYDVDIKIDRESKNRSAEILNTRLKTMGYRLVFKKTKKKKRVPMLIPALEFTYDPNNVREAIEFVSKDYDINSWIKTLEDIDNITKENGDKMRHAVMFTDKIEEEMFDCDPKDNKKK